MLWHLFVVRRQEAPLPETSTRRATAGSSRVDHHRAGAGARPAHRRTVRPVTCGAHGCARLGGDDCPARHSRARRGRRATCSSLGRPGIGRRGSRRVSATMTQVQPAMVPAGAQLSGLLWAITVRDRDVVPSYMEWIAPPLTALFPVIRLFRMVNVPPS